MKRLLLVWVVASAAMAQEPEGYRTAAKLGEALRLLEAAPDGAAKVVVLGKSHEGREILAVRLRRGAAGPRPVLLVIAGVDGNLPAGSEMAALLAADLATATDERAKALLGAFEVVVIPRLNPDGCERFFEEVLREDAGTARAWDEDRDGDADEDGPDDMDGDKAILSMRVEDAAGEWMSDEGRMRKPDASKGERGTHRLLVEGRDDDGDGAWNEDGRGGIDLNSNFPWNYRAHGARTGPYQVSEPEARALADFVIATPEIEAVFVFGAADSCVRQFAPSPPPNPAPDPGRPAMGIDEADRLYFARGAELWRKRMDVERMDPGPMREGGVREWAYFHEGVLSLGNPGWSVPWRKATNKGEHPDEDRDTHRWMRANRADAWVEWHAVEHPDFPGKKVEIGGWKPFSRTNPPAAELPTLAQKHGEFARDLMEMFPRLELRDATVKKLDAALFEIKVTVANTGALPTSLRHGSRTERARDVRVDLVLGDGQVLTAGKRVSMVKPLSALGGAQEMKWVVKGSGAIEVKAETDKAGRASWKAELR